MALELFSRAGQVALITGGNGGTGRAMALGMQQASAASDIVAGACLPVDGGYAISDRFIEA